VIYPIENTPGVLEAEQKWAHATLLLRWKEVMAARNSARSFPKSLRAQNFATNGTDEFFAGTVSGTAE